MIRLVVLAGAVASMLVLLGTAGAASHPQLVGVVGQNDAYKITLSSGGKVAKTLEAGTYTLRHPRRLRVAQLRARRPEREVVDVHDRAVRRHEDGDAEARPGAYKAYCAPHETIMFQHFTVELDRRRRRRPAAVLRAGHRGAACRFRRCPGGGRQSHALERVLGHTRALRNGLRQRRLVDLLRPRRHRGDRARADAARLRRLRADLRVHRGDLRRGDGELPRGRRLVELRAPRVQRARVVRGRLGADAQLHHHGRHLGVLRAALPLDLLGAAEDEPVGHRRRGRSSSSSSSGSTSSGSRRRRRSTSGSRWSTSRRSCCSSSSGFVLIFSPHVLKANIHWGVAPTWSNFALAIPVAMIAYTGIETVSNLAEEARDPRRDDPGLDPARRDRRLRDLLHAAARRALGAAGVPGPETGDYVTRLGLRPARAGSRTTRCSGSSRTSACTARCSAPRRSTSASSRRRSSSSPRTPA